MCYLVRIEIHIGEYASEPRESTCFEFVMTGENQRTYVQKDGTIVPHSSRPLSVRLNDFLASIILFFTLFFHSLFQV